MKEKLITHLLKQCGAGCLTLALTLLPVYAEAQRLTIVKGEVDCGKAAYEVPVTATFELRNKGGRKLYIHKAHTDCGCIDVKYPTEGIDGGDRFTVSLTYDARQLGHFNKTVGLYTNASDKPVYLRMKGVVLADYVDYSKSYPYTVGNLCVDRLDLEFENVNKGEHPTQEIRMVNNGTSMLSPNMMHLPNYLVATMQPEHLAPGKTGKMVVTLLSEKLRDYGLTQTSLHLANKPGDKVSADNEVVASAVLLPDLSLYQGMQKQMAPHMSLSAEQLNIAFGKKSKKKGEIIITNTGRSNLKISSLQLFTAGLRVELSKSVLPPGATAKLRITAVRSELAKVRTKPRVLMITNDPDKPHVTITVNAK